MAITSVTPASSSTIQTGDSFSFTVDDTYTSMVIQSQSDTALESVYNSATTGAQAGYTVTVVDNGDSTHTFTVSRDAGWEVSPQLVYVTEDETGSSATTNLSYLLQVEQTFPQGQSPYNGADGSATTDHGTLLGLGDDDHTQYHNDTRGDARYTPIAHGAGDGSDHADVATNTARAPLSGAGAPGASTGNGKNVGHIYIDTTDDDAYTLVDATTDANVWSSGGAGQKLVFHYAGSHKANDTTSTWIGHKWETLWNSGIASQSYGTGALPANNVYCVGPIMPYDGNITEVQCWYRVASSAVEGDIALMKTTFADGAATTTEAQIGSNFVVPSGGANTNRYDLSTTLSSSNAVSKGDTVVPFYRNGGTGAATIYICMTFVLEIT